MPYDIPIVSNLPKGTSQKFCPDGNFSITETSVTISIKQQLLVLFLVS